MYEINNSTEKYKRFRKCEIVMRYVYFAWITIVAITFTVNSSFYYYSHFVLGYSPKINFTIYECVQFFGCLLPILLIFMPLICIIKKYHHQQYKINAKQILFFFIFEMISSSSNAAVYFYAKQNDNNFHSLYYSIFVNSGYYSIF